MKKRRFVLHVSVAGALCAAALTAPAAADDGPQATIPPRVAPVVPWPHPFAPFDAFIEYARALSTTQKAQSDSVAAPAPAASTPEVTTAIPARATTIARSYPRTFSTYDELAQYASSVAAAQQASNDRLAAVLAARGCQQSPARQRLRSAYPRRLAAVASRGYGQREHSSPAGAACD